MEIKSYYVVGYFSLHGGHFPYCQRVWNKIFSPQGQLLLSFRGVYSSLAGSGFGVWPQKGIALFGQETATAQILVAYSLSLPRRRLFVGLPQSG